MEIEAVAEAIGEEAKASGVLTAIQRLAAEAATEAPKRGRKHLENIKSKVPNRLQQSIGRNKQKQLKKKYQKRK
uniref:Candidate secreted effector n=1 Tax=Meloidogyne incognita TaxID=6306 RepID=A0A914MRM8_MELIC